MLRVHRLCTACVLILCAGLPLSGKAACKAAHESDAAASHRRAVVSALAASVVDSPSNVGAGILERMAHFDVPAVSIAVVNDGRLEWASAYGFKTAGGKDAACITTLFQAASMSKPVTALAVLRLVDRKQLELDRDVNERLRSWHIPTNELSRQQPVTLRLILSHRAGLTTSGFPGYGYAERVPNAADVLSGRGNTEAVVVDTMPGTSFRYSGGGYVVAQQLIQDVTGKPFAEVLQRLVLGPAQMGHSTFAQPLPKNLTRDAASAHVDGKLVEGRWHVYPELAPAGLWTTPTDFTKIMLAIRSAWLGEPGALLEQNTAREMLTPHEPGGYGLGPGLGGTGDTLLFAHPGGNFGFAAFMVMYPTSGDGIVVMNNGGNPELNMEIVRAAAVVYDWPHFKPEVRSDAK